MTKLTSWLLQQDRDAFLWLHNRLRAKVVHYMLAALTNLGGAVFTIVVTLGLALFGSGTWRMIGFQSLTALSLSHIPVAVFKKKFPRLRPYLVLPHVITGRNPLADHSFPSGHSTAVFSVAVTFAWHFPAVAPLLLLLAALVAMSRIHLGLHYPSDCLAGASLGTMVSLAVCLLWPF